MDYINCMNQYERDGYDMNAGSTHMAQRWVEQCRRNPVFHFYAVDLPSYPSSSSSSSSSSPKPATSSASFPTEFSAWPRELLHRAHTPPTRLRAVQGAAIQTCEEVQPRILIARLRPTPTALRILHFRSHTPHTQPYTSHTSLLPLLMLIVLCHFFLVVPRCDQR